MSILLILKAIGSDVLSNAAYDALKAGLSRLFRNSTETIDEVYTKKFENIIISLSNEAGIDDRLIVTDSLLQFLRKDMIHHAILLNEISEEERPELREAIIKELFRRSDIASHSSSSRAYRQANSIITDYTKNANELLSEIDPDYIIRKELLNSPLNLRNMLSVIIGQNKAIEDYVKRIIASLHFDRKSLCLTLKRRLVYERTNHPSFKFMSKHKSEFAPTAGKLCWYHNPYGTTQESKCTRPVWDIIRDSWHMPERTHIILEGNGGIGKTVILLNATDLDDISDRIATIYLPARLFVDDSNQTAVTFEQCLKNHSFPKAEEIIKLSEDASWTDESGAILGPSVLVLLDGINEIAPSFQNQVLAKINEWCGSLDGVQIIATTRSQEETRIGHLLSGKTLSITLEPIPKDEVIQFLQTSHDETGHPEEVLSKDSPMMDFLVYPLFLTIYLETTCLKTLPYDEYTLNLREEISGPNTLLLDFMQRELCRKQSPEWVIRAAIVYEYIYPRIAYEMVMRQTMVLPKETVRALVKEMLDTFSSEQYSVLPAHVRTLIIQHDKIEGDLPKYPSKNTAWYNLVFYECGLLSTPKNRKSDDNEGCKKNTSERLLESAFIHQAFRDCLAAVYLLNHADNMTDFVPYCWKKTFPPAIMNSIVELVTENQADTLWERNRLDQQYNLPNFHKDHTTTGILLELWKKRGLPRELDFSGMDLRGFSLAKYCFSPQHRCSSLFSSPLLSKKTKFDQKTFCSIGHIEDISCLYPLSDSCFVSGSEDSSLIVWDANIETAIQKFEGHTDWVTCIATLSDGRIVSGSRDKTIRIWDTNDPYHPQILAGHSGWINCLICLPDGRIVSGSEDTTLRVWDLATPNEPIVLEGHVSPIVSINSLPNGQIISGAWDGEIIVWDLERPTDITTLPSHQASLCSVTVLADGRIVSSYRDASLRIWNLQDKYNPLSLSCNGTVAECIAVLPNGYFVCGCDDFTLRVWDPNAPNISITLSGHTDTITNIAVFPDGRFISCSHDETLRLWDLVNPQNPLVFTGAGDWLTDVLVLPNGQIISSSCGFLHCWDIRQPNEPQFLFEYNDGIAWNTVLSDNRIVCGLYDGTLRILSLEHPQKPQIICPCDKYQYIAFSKRYLDSRIVCGFSDYTWRILDIDNPYKQHTFLPWRRFTRECFSFFPDGRFICGYQDGSLRIWDPVAQDTGALFASCGSRVTCVEVLTNGRFVSASTDGLIRVWNIDGPNITPHILASPTGVVRRIVSLPDNRFMCQSQSKEIWICDANNMEVVQIIDNWKDINIHTSCLPDGRLVGSSFQLGESFICDIKDHLHPLRLVEQAYGENECSVLSDGKIVLSHYDKLFICDIETKQVYTHQLSELDISNYDFSMANLSNDILLAKMLWQNGATISDNDKSLFEDTLWEPFDYYN